MPFWRRNLDAGINDADLDAIVAWLRTVPPID